MPDVHPRPRKRLARCTLDCGFKNPESPALRGFVAERAPITGTSLYLVIFSNGPHCSKNLPVKFGFSPKTVPANIAQKLPPQRCPQPLLIPIFNFSHKWPTFALTPESGYNTHSVFGERSHTAAYTPKQGPSLPRPQCGFVPPAKYLIFRHAFIYIHFPVLCEPSPSAKGENPAKLPPRLYLKPFFNFPHKWPTFAFTGESGYTLGSLRKIAHKGSHAETGVFRTGVVSLPSERFTRSRTSPGRVSDRRTLPLLSLGRRCSRRTQRAFGTAMRLCASLFRGVAAPLGCVIFFTSVEIAACTPCVQGFPHVWGRGGITTLGVLHMFSKRWMAACQNGSFAVF